MNAKIIQGSNAIFTNRFKTDSVVIDTVKNATLTINKAVKDLNYFHATGTDTSIATNNTSFDILHIYPTIVKSSSTYSYDSPSRTITINASGFYFVSGICEIEANSFGLRQISILVNGNANKGLKQVYKACPSGTTILHAFGLKYLDAGDTFKLQIYQNSGSNLNVGNSSTGQTFYLVRLGI
jgi:hypothetical protein